MRIKVDSSGFWCLKDHTFYGPYKTWDELTEKHPTVRDIVRCEEKSQDGELSASLP